MTLLTLNHRTVVTTGILLDRKNRLILIGLSFSQPEGLRFKSCLAIKKNEEFSEYPKKLKKSICRTGDAKKRGHTFLLR